MDQDMAEACAVACGFLARLFQECPSREWLLTLRDRQLLEEWPLAMPAEQGREGDTGLRLMARFVAELDEAGIAAIRRDHAAMFVGPGDPLPQWESVCLTEDRLLFGEPAFAVRRLYAEFGLALPPESGEADDHVGYELAFVASLLHMAADALAEARIAQAEIALHAAAAFLREHLLPWVGEFLDALQARADTPFYRGAAMLCRDTLRAVAGFPGESGR